MYDNLAFIDINERRDNNIDMIRVRCIHAFLFLWELRYIAARGVMFALGIAHGYAFALHATGRLGCAWYATWFFLSTILSPICMSVCFSIRLLRRMAEVICSTWNRTVEICDGADEIARRTRHGISLSILFFVSGLSSVICCIFWRQSTYLINWIHWTLETPWFVCIAAIWSIFVAIVMTCIWNLPKYNLLKLLLLASVVLYWLMAGCENFNWASLCGIILCFCSICLVLFPLIKVDYRAEKTASPDRVGRRLLYRHAADYIRERAGKEFLKGISVAVCGPWGCGKSHFINYLGTSLHYPRSGNATYASKTASPDIYMGEFVECKVDLWQSSDNMAMWNDIASALASAISGRSLFGVKRCGLSVDGIAKVLHLPYASLLEAIMQIMTTGSSGSQASVDVLESRIRKSGKAYVLILENLDRCPKHKMETFFPLIERLRAISGLVTICGIAQESIVQEYDDTRNVFNSIPANLIKVFDVILPIPVVSQKYTKSFLLYLVEQYGKSCPNLARWIHEQKLRFDTPRQMEHIINHLALMDRCYFRSGESESFLSRTVGSNGRAHSSFYMSILQVLYPDYAELLQKTKSPHKLLLSSISYLGIDQREDIFEEERFFDEYDEEEEENADNYKDVLSKQVYASAVSLCEKYASSSLFVSLINEINKLSRREMSYVVKQDYLNISNLSKKECKQVEQHFAASGKPLLEVIRDVFREEYMEVDELGLYRDVLTYAMRHPGNPVCKQMIEKCVEDDVIKDDGIVHEYLQTGYLLFKLFKIAVELYEGKALQVHSEDDNSEEWINGLLEKLLPNITLAALGEVLVVLTSEYVFSAKCPEVEFCDNETNSAYREFRRVVRMILSEEEQKEFRKRALALLSPCFAERFCRRLLYSYRGISKYYDLFLKLWRENNKQLEEGVEKCISSSETSRYASLYRLPNLLGMLIVYMETEIDVDEIKNYISSLSGVWVCLESKIRDPKQIPESWIIRRWNKLIEVINEDIKICDEKLKMDNNEFEKKYLDEQKKQLGLILLNIQQWENFV